MTARWQDVEYKSELITDARAQALVTSLERSYSNGRVLLLHLAPTAPDTFSLASRHDLQGYDHLLATFLRAPSVHAALSELALPSAQALPPPYRSIGAFEFEGALTHALVAGGAYGGAVPEEAARRLSRDFVDCCFDDRRLSVTVFAIQGAWTDWFYDVAWDGTYLCLDRVASRWTCLFFTDTD